MANVETENSATRVPLSVRNLNITRLSPVGGAAIEGLDLSQPIDTALTDAILAAFRRHHVLAFQPIP